MLRPVRVRLAKPRAIPSRRQCGSGKTRCRTQERRRSIGPSTKPFASMIDIPDSIPENLVAGIVEYLSSGCGIDEHVARLNALRNLIGSLSAFATEPVDLVEWVKADSVHANDYNPNTVAPPEMELLRLSIMADGFTQPIVTMPDEQGREVIDGFHRHRVGKEMDDVRHRIRGYLPVVRIRSDRQSRNDRIASTIRHNRARGKHRVEAMSDIVIELKRRNWADDKIATELGMEPDEVLRLCQISGLADLFSDEDFSDSWDAETPEDYEGFDGDEFAAGESERSPGSAGSIKRIYHTWDEWECYAAGFFDNTPGHRNLTADQCKSMYSEFLQDIPRFQAAIDGVFRNWPNSTEHNLTNDRMNRIAWLGQAAMCWDTGVPAAFCNGYSQMPKAAQEAADFAALEKLNEWLSARGYPTLASLSDAARRTQPELY